MDTRAGSAPAESSEQAPAPAPAPAQQPVTGPAAATPADCGISLRRLRPSDQNAIYCMWLEGWDATLELFMPTAWARWARKMLRAAAVLALIAILHAGLPAAVSAAAAVAAPAAVTAGTGASWLSAGLAALQAAAQHSVMQRVAQVAAATWVLSAAPAAAVLAAWIAMRTMPKPLATPIFKVLAMHAFIKPQYKDMWALYDSWVTSPGRDYWVAVDDANGQVVGGVGIKLGTGARKDHGNGIASGKQGAAWEQEQNGTHGFTAQEERMHGGQLYDSDVLVFRMVTHGSMRRRGIGRALLERALQVAAERGATRAVCVSGNPEAITFYGKCGFSEVFRFPGKSGGAVMGRKLVA